MGYATELKIMLNRARERAAEVEIVAHSCPSCAGETNNGFVTEEEDGPVWYSKPCDNCVEVNEAKGLRWSFGCWRKAKP